MCLLYWFIFKCLSLSSETKLSSSFISNWASQMALMVKNHPVNAGDIRYTGSILGGEDPLEEGMATHFSTFAWRIPWTEESGGL